MARRKKRMKLPNGFGSIKYLGAGRRNPYAVYPPVQEYTAAGPVAVKALAYKETWEEAYQLLTAYNMERNGQIKVSSGLYIDRTPTFKEVYEQFFNEKYKLSGKGYSKASIYSSNAAFKNCAAIRDKQFGQLKYDDLQKVVNECELKHSSIELIINLLHQIYKYAMKYEIIDKDYSQFLYIPKPEDDEGGVPFTDADLKILWKNKADPVAEMLLIMCYSGYRIKAYTDITVDLNDGYFQGGVKSKSGRNRVVPIHSAILPLVARRVDGSRNLLIGSIASFRKNMYTKLDEFGIERHTPHDCRHTFSALCEKYGVTENDRKRMMGHSFGSDITNAKYGHRTLEELKTEIEKIKTKED